MIKKKQKKVEIETHQEDAKTNEMGNNDLVDIDNKVGNFEMINSENKTNSSRLTEAKAESLVGKKENKKNKMENDKNSNNLGFVENKIDIVGTSDGKSKTNEFIPKLIKFKLEKRKNKDEQGINWNFITLGILFFVGTVLAFFFDAYLFISIGFLAIGLCSIFLGLKDTLKTCVAYKFFDFSPPKQNKTRDVFAKNRNRTENNNLVIEANIDSKTFYT